MSWQHLDFLRLDADIPVAPGGGTPVGPSTVNLGELPDVLESRGLAGVNQRGPFAYDVLGHTRAVATSGLREGWKSRLRCYVNPERQTYGDVVLSRFRPVATHASMFCSEATTLVPALRRCLRAHEPQRHMRGLHRLAHDVEQLGVQRFEIHLLA